MRPRDQRPQTQYSHSTTHPAPRASTTEGLAQLEIEIEGRKNEKVEIGSLRLLIQELTC